MKTHTLNHFLNFSTNKNSFSQFSFIVSSWKCIGNKIHSINDAFFYFFCFHHQFSLIWFGNQFFLFYVLSFFLKYYNEKQFLYKEKKLIHGSLNQPLNCTYRKQQINCLRARCNYSQQIKCIYPTNASIIRCLL
jgi:hypothetical protein